MALPTISNDNTLFNTDDFLSPKVYQDGVTDIVDRLKREGDLTRDSGTNSIKSLKEVSFNLLTSTELHLDYMKKLLDNFGGLENSIKDSTDATLDYFRQKEITDEERYRELERREDNDDGGARDGDSESEKEDFSITSLLAAAVVPGILALTADMTGWLDDLVVAIGGVFKLAQRIFVPLRKGLTLINTFFTNTFQGFMKTVKPIFSLFGKLKLFLDPILKIAPSILGGLGKIFPMFTIITGIIDFAKGFTDKFSAADTIGEGILEGLYGGITEVISGIITRPLDLLKDFAGWLATKLGFPQVEEVLDKFSFDDMFRKAVSWFYDTETNEFFGGFFNIDFSAKYTEIKNAIFNWFKDNIYDGENNKIFGMQLPSGSMEWSEWYTNLKTKISTWFKDNIYDGENNKIFGFAIPEKLFEFNMFQTIKQPIDDVIDTIKQIFSGDFSMETLLKGGKAFLDLVYAPLNLAINAIKDIFKWGDPEEPFRLSKFITDAVASIKSFFTNEEGTGLFDFDLSKIELPDFDIGKKFKEFIDEIGKFISDMIPSKESIVASAAKAIDTDGDGKITGGEKVLSSPLNLLGYEDSELEALITKYAEPKEKGGPIQEDKPYLVGEAGPELIIPNSSGKVIPAPQTGAILDAGSRMMADNARVSVSPVIAPQSNDNRTIVSNKSVTYQGHMTTRNSDPTIRALNSSLAYA